MKFKAHATIQGNPELRLRANCQPLGFDVHAEGSFKLGTGPINAEIDEIPVTLRIPFLRRRGGLVAIGTIGAFGVHLKPIDAEFRTFGVRVGGVLGKDGMQCDLDAAVTCKTAIDADGVIPAKVTRVAFHVADDEEEKAEHEA